MGGGGNKTSTTDSGVPDWAQPYLEGAAKDATKLYDKGALDNVAGLNKDQKAAHLDTREMQRMGLDLGQDASKLYNKAGKHKAFNRADQTSNQAANQRGVFSANQYGKVADQMQPQIDNQVTRALGQQSGAFSNTGNLGGARAQAASAGAAGQIAGDMSAAEVAAQRGNAMSGAQMGVDSANAQFGQQINALAGRSGALQTGMGANQQYAASGQMLQDQSQAEQDAKYQGIQRLFGLVNPGTVGSTQTTNSTGGK